MTDKSNNPLDWFRTSFGHLVDKHIASMQQSGKIPKGIDASELKDAGEYGMIKALHTFDPEKGSLSAHVNNNIRGHIQSHVASLMEHMGVPRGLHGAAKEFSRAKGAGETVTAAPQIDEKSGGKP